MIITRSINFKKYVRNNQVNKRTHKKTNSDLIYLQITYQRVTVFLIKVENKIG